ncbi:hypothetical protein GTV15_12290, partial [Streptomyces sp. SID7803]|nr:hypothetical protein [Streptomyces sp. SID7803]
MLLECRSHLDGTGLGDLLPLGGRSTCSTWWSAPWDGPTECRRHGPRGTGPHRPGLRADGGTVPGLRRLHLVAPRTITIGEAEVRVGSDQLHTIADIASRTVDEAFLAQSGRVRLDTVPV